MNLNEIKKAYFIGIKGSGMTAIAEILKERGVDVSGSDIKEKFFTDEILKKNKIGFKEEFDEKNIPNDIDLIIYSTAYSENNNPEIVEAKRRNILMLSYPEVLGALIGEKLGIAVCGTHGKTTTTALLAEAFRSAGVDPGAVVGSKVIDWEGSVLTGKGNYFIAEADEYQNKFQHYNPWGVVLTSCDWDHPDFFPNFGEYKKAFEDFVSKVPKHGFLVECGDEANVCDIGKNAKCEVLTYGFLEGNDYKITNYELKIKNNLQFFSVYNKEKKIGDFEIQLIGKHNILNAAAVVAVCHKLKFDLEKAREALKNFKGTSRRFEFIGKRNGAILIDDYAHHPEEIKATLRAAREIYNHKNIIAVFHPHTFTRTKALLSEFSQSFDCCDTVIVLDIYGSAREIQGGVSSKDLTDLINKYNQGKAEYIPTIQEAMDFLKDKIGGKDVVISMGAGNVWQVTDKLKE
ncbi:MAG: UDP-N-acetylmuramate--L-alanine ligase [bacterium]|nr:UDP-N-acetylmuramate--L-alanine ligase [bacterium]